MPVIASKNYYQKKVWEMSSIKAEIREESARMTPTELGAQKASRQESLERIQRDVEDRAERTVVMPSPWRRWKYKEASKLALDVAEYFQFNVHIEAEEQSGEIRLIGDEIMSEALLWHDQKQKCKLLKVIKWAESVWMDVKKDDDVPLVDIHLSYTLVRKRISGLFRSQILIFYNFVIFRQAEYSF